MNTASTLSLPPVYLQRAQALLAAGGRRLLGIAGPPGAGKSTVAALLQSALGGQAQVVPMDGFHLAQAELLRLGLADRKGAPDTFDAHGFVALLRRLRQPREGEVVYAPEFRREIEEPVAGALAVPASTPLVIVEGNYLLLDTPPWDEVAPLLDACWYVAVDDGLRVQRLTTRHQQFGRSAQAAAEWVQRSDEANARLVQASAARATLAFRWDAT
ncbi:nucleoside/nucleotide kinase family protein [Ideonella sp. BN130291]|uniref:nucleoside/nucleotide kinase family protein n=1 Tax=Ideonella sp. BN130291 TaxID=3112940 RepID=UPI002E26B16E|nr:nucleoside/nucleotide kinase family protein [Ideonella sp. BN130291]